MVDVFWFADLIAVFMTIAAMSFFFKRTIFFRVAEITFVGVATGWMLALAVRNINDIAIRNLTVTPTLIIPIILGIAFYTRLTRRFYWVSRFPVAVLVGSGIAVAVYGEISSNLIRQIAVTMAPITTDRKSVV